MSEWQQTVFIVLCTIDWVYTFSMLLIPTKFLLLLAAVVWIAAGVSVTSVGVSAHEAGWTVPMLIGFLIVFALFLMMFIRITLRHKKRILGYTEELKNLFLFFDAQSYILIFVMIVLGVGVRISNFVPNEVIASMYSGIGLALLVCAVYYVVTFFSVFEYPFLTKSKDSEN